MQASLRPVKKGGKRCGRAERSPGGKRSPFGGDRLPEDPHGVTPASRATTVSRLRSHFQIQHRANNSAAPVIAKRFCTAFPPRANVSGDCVAIDSKQFA
jgi:hypothetical protein